MENSATAFTDPASYTYTSVHLAPEEQIDLHRQSTWELSYIITGAGVRLIGDTTEPFQSGEVILIPPGIPHCWYFDSQTTDTHGRIANITVTFTTAFLDGLCHLFPVLAPFLFHFNGRKDAVKFPRERSVQLAGILEKMRDLSAEQRVAPMIELLIAMADIGAERVVGRFRRTDRDHDRINQVKVYVICNSCRNITLDDVALHVGMNRAAFCTFFKRATGKTFINYLNEYRVEQACKLLMQGGITVAEACYHVGFNNVPYFNRVFKRLKGVSPTMYTG